MLQYILIGGVLSLFFKNDETKKKRVFISFAIEDIEYRDHLVAQAKKNHSPFEFIDMSVKVKWNQNIWKKRCRTKIKKCDGVIALLSKNTHNAGGARWEMKCAKEENIKIIGMHIKKKDKGAIPIELYDEEIIEWTWENLEKCINQL
ncbi:MAG: TIR domain-containing protein [Flavobacterium sp.]